MSDVVGMDAGRLRSIPVESALEVCRLDFAARQSHRLEDALVAKRRLLIRLFGRGGAFICALSDRVVVRFRHKSLYAPLSQVHEQVTVTLLDYRTFRRKGQCKFRYGYYVSYRSAWFGKLAGARFSDGCIVLRDDADIPEKSNLSIGQTKENAIKSNAKQKCRGFSSPRASEIKPLEC